MNVQMNFKITPRTWTTCIQNKKLVEENRETTKRGERKISMEKNELHKLSHINS